MGRLSVVMYYQSSYFLRCIRCHETEGSESKVLVCPRCGGPIEAIYDYEKLRSSFRQVPQDKKVMGIWKYAPLLPLSERTKPVTLGEGNTPLTKVEVIGSKLGLKKLYVKDESRNPTLSFKDRKSTMAITKALEFGVKRIANITAGNAGASMAAYASKAGIASYVFTFKGINEAKMAKLVSYHANVFKTEAKAPALTKFVNAVCKKYGLVNMTAATRYNPYLKEGAKTAVFELYEQMNGLPDWIVVPVGGGGNLASYFKGLRELKSLGLIEGYPKLVGVQAKDCAPVVRAFERDLPPENIPTIRNGRTIAHSIFDEWAPDGDQVLIAIKETKGIAIDVTDRQILNSMKLLSSKEGIFVEPASAAPLAAVRKLAGEGKIEDSESIVMVATGSGLNQPEATIRAWGMPRTIPADVKSFETYQGRR